MNWSMTIPSNGSSVPVKKFAAEADVAFDEFAAANAEDERAHLVEQAAVAVEQAKNVVASGAAGEEHVYVALSGYSTGSDREMPTTRIGNIVGIEVHQRPRPVVAPADAEEEVVQLREPAAPATAPSTSNDVVCSECGKGFDTERQLKGHALSHRRKAAAGGQK